MIRPGWRGFAGRWVGVLLVVAARAAAADCTPITTGVDTTHWNAGRQTFFGRAVGQTFYASDTLITRITVWRYPNNLAYTVGAHLFVTSVDTINYAPPMPTTEHILLDGPTVLVHDSDPPGLPIRMDYVLDPALALPRPGTYAFFVQREGCDAGGTVLIAKEPGTYPHGTFWITGRTSFLPCALARAEVWDDSDLCHEIEYCQSVTPIRGESWGRLKVSYR